MIYDVSERLFDGLVEEKKAVRKSVRKLNEDVAKVESNYIRLKDTLDRALASAVRHSHIHTGIFPNVLVAKQPGDATFATIHEFEKEHPEVKVFNIIGGNFNDFITDSKNLSALKANNLVLVISDFDRIPSSARAAALSLLMSHEINGEVYNNILFTVALVDSNVSMPAAERARFNYIVYPEMPNRKVREGYYDDPNAEMHFDFSQRFDPKNPSEAMGDTEMYLYDMCDILNEDGEVAVDISSAEGKAKTDAIIAYIPCYQLKSSDHRNMKKPRTKGMLFNKDGSINEVSTYIDGDNWYNIVVDKK